MRSCGAHLRAISQEMLKISILDMSMKMNNLRRQMCISRFNELIGDKVKKVMKVFDKFWCKVLFSHIGTSVTFCTIMVE